MKQAMRVLGGVACMLATLTQAAGPLKLDTPMDAPLARAMLARWGYGATDASVAALTGQTPRAMVQRGWRAPSGVAPAVRTALDALADAPPLAERWAQYGPARVQEARKAQDIPLVQSMARQGNAMKSATVQRRLLMMANSDNPAHEVLLAFWLNHFSVYLHKGQLPWLVDDYASRIEAAMADDRFESLLRAAFYHTAMQGYLDNINSTAPDSELGRRGRTGLNENLARELLELHTLGVGGGYQQADVEATARLISGVSAPDLGTADALADGGFALDPRRRGEGWVQVLGQTYALADGRVAMDALLHRLALHPATARHVSRKLAQRFVGDTPPAALVERMAQAYVQSGGRLSPALWVMLASPAFADSLLKQRMFRLPQDYVLATARAVCQDAPITHAEPLLNMLQAMGQAPFLRLTPDGYPQNAGEWQTALGMALRVQLAQALAQRQWRLTGPADAAQACNWDAAAAERSLGPWTAATRAAAEGLPPAQQAILLLSSPATLWR